MSGRSVLAIDPGPKTSGVVLYDGGVGFAMGECENIAVLSVLNRNNAVVIERMQFYGSLVGAPVLETLRWSGRFEQRALDQGATVQRVYYADVRQHFCGGGFKKAKESHVRAAVLDRFGGRAVAVGTKHAPGPLYSVKSHAWSALALALLWWDRSQGLEDGTDTALTPQRTTDA